MIQFSQVFRIGFFVYFYCFFSAFFRLFRLFSDFGVNNCLKLQIIA